MKYEMKLQPEYFDKIKFGKKIYEIRLNDEKRKNIDVGDVITFTREPNLEESLNTIVKDLIYFDSFDEMIETLPADKIGFENYDKNFIKQTYRKFYSKESEMKYGVVAIKIALI